MPTIVDPPTPPEPTGNVGKISGPLLKSNLERNGVNLSVETDLLYIDVITGRVGINTPAPASDFEVNGTAKVTSIIVDNIYISDTIEATAALTLTAGTTVDIQKPTTIYSTLTVNDDITLIGNNILTPNNTVISPDNGTGTLTIDGNITINGDTTTINSSTVSIADKNIVIGSGSGDRSIANGAGLTVDLGTDGNATLTYRSIDDSFIFNKPLILDAGITISGQNTSINDLILTGSIQGPSVLLIDPETHGDNTGTVSIAGDLIVTGQNTTLNDLAVSNITTTGSLLGPAIMNIDPAAHGDNTGLLNVLGELTVNGTSTVINELSSGTITTTGSINGPTTFTIAPAADPNGGEGGSGPGTVAISGNIDIAGNVNVQGNNIVGTSPLTLVPSGVSPIVSVTGDFHANGISTTATGITVPSITSTGSITGPATFDILASTKVNIDSDFSVDGLTTTVNNLLAAELSLSSNMNVPTDFTITPATSGTVLVAGDFEVTGSSVDIAGTLTGPAVFDIVPNDINGAVNIGGDLVVAGDATTLNDLDVGNITTTGYIRGPETMVIDPHIYDVELGLVRIEGSLDVKGADTTLRNVSALGDITTTGTLFGPANFTIDPAAYGDNSGTVNILGNVTIGDYLTVANNATVGSLNTGTIITTGQLQGPTNFIIDPAVHGDNSGTVSISGDLAVNGANTTLNDLAVSNITASGYLRGPANFTIDPATYGDDTGTVIIAGNLQVNAGTVTAQSSSFDDLTVTGRLNGPATFIIDPATHGDNTGLVDVYGDLTVEGTTTNMNDLFVNNITSTGYLRGPTTFTIDPATYGDNSGTVVIAGNLQVDGVTTTINSTIVSIEDKQIVVASGSANNAAANGAGLQVDLGTDGTANLTYDSASSGFKVDKNFETIGELRVHGNTGNDSIVLRGSGSGASNYAVDIQPAPLTANRSVTLPNADVTLVGGTMVPTSRTISITNSSGVTGASATSLANDIDFNIGLDGQALALHNFNQTGMMVRTGAETFAGRQIEVSGIGIAVTNANGLNGNPSISCNATHANTANAIVSRDASGNFTAHTITAALNGNANTATSLQTTRTINGVSFNGTSSITITANTSNALTRGSYLTGGSSSFNGSTASTWSVNASTSGTSNVVARDASGNFSAGTITAALSGNANTATTLQTARTINGVSFNGGADITIHANTTNTLSPGSYLSGLAFNGSQTTTWNVDATSANTANKVVARDASGNFTAGTITAGLNASSHVIPTADGVYNLGSSSNKWNTIYGNTFTGVATTAKYADLAENYVADTDYEPGTVLIFGGEFDVTITNEHTSRRVAGVVSTNPAHLMDKDLKGEYIVALALQGKVPCKVYGIVKKGDLLVTSKYDGYAMVNNTPEVGSVIGKALENKTTIGVGVITVVVGRD